MEAALNLQKSSKNTIQLPIKNKNIRLENKIIEISASNQYNYENKPFSAPLSSSPPNDFLNILKKRIDDYF